MSRLRITASKPIRIFTRIQIHRSVPRSNSTLHYSNFAMFAISTQIFNNPLRSEALEHSVETQKQDRSKNNRPRLRLLWTITNLHIYPKQILQSAVNYIRHSLHMCHWCLVTWLYYCGAVSRSSIIPWGRWVRADRHDDGSLGSAALNIGRKGMQNQEIFHRR